MKADTPAAMDEPVMVAVGAVASPAWLLGCHEAVTTPVALVVPELGVKVVVNVAAGYPAPTPKVTGTPACDGTVRVAVTVRGEPPAVYDVGLPVTVIVGGDWLLWFAAYAAACAAMEVSVQDGPGYAPVALASETEVVNTPVTGADAAGDAGPWMSTVPADPNVPVNPGGIPVADVHSIAVSETAEVLNP